MAYRAGCQVQLSGCRLEGLPPTGSFEHTQQGERQLRRHGWLNFGDMSRYMNDIQHCGNRFFKGFRLIVSLRNGLSSPMTGNRSMSACEPVWSNAPYGHSKQVPTPRT
jgi:hypothetical protein